MKPDSKLRGMCDKLNEDKIVVFQSKKIRRTWHDDEWYFSVVDIVEALTESSNSRDYWYRLKKREFDSSGIELSTFCRQLKLRSVDGKFYNTDCANTKSIFRLIQSIPSKKAEPFKRWLASVGYQRVLEIENPELAQQRMKEIYRVKGYSNDWIEKRMRGIAVRDELTDEWDRRGVEGNREYSILTAEISKATFGLTPSQYQELKGLKKENLRDHMDDMELILTMLGEASTTRLTRVRDSREFPHLKKDARDGGDVAGSARRDIEGKLERSVVSPENYLDAPERQKRLAKEQEGRIERVEGTEGMEGTKGTEEKRKEQ